MNPPNLSLHFNGHFTGEPRLAGVYWIVAKDDGRGGDNWTTGAICRANLRQNIDFKRKSTLVIMTYKSETRKYLDDMTGEVYQLCSVNAKTLITNARQQNNMIITEKLVSNRNC